MVRLHYNILHSSHLSTVCVLQEVLEEVNTDYSNSIEFYEYLLLSKKCLDVTGAQK